MRQHDNMTAGPSAQLGPNSNPESAPLVAPGLNMVAKMALLALLSLAVVNPEYGHLEGKAPVARAVAYPLLAFALPAIWVASRPRRPYPWAADLLLTLMCFSDILGNRLNLYDSVVWFDDWMHYMNGGLLGAAAVLLTVRDSSSRTAAVERAVAVSVTGALARELYEYVTFMTHSAERPMAYTDTLADLSLGWLGAVCAGCAVHALWGAQVRWRRRSSQ